MVGVSTATKRGGNPKRRAGTISLTPSDVADLYHPRLPVRVALLLLGLAAALGVLAGVGLQNGAGYTAGYQAGWADGHANRILMSHDTDK